MQYKYSLEKVFFERLNYSLYLRIIYRYWSDQIWSKHNKYYFPITPFRGEELFQIWGTLGQINNVLSLNNI